MSDDTLEHSSIPQRPSRRDRRRGGGVPVQPPERRTPARKLRDAVEAEQRAKERESIDLIVADSEWRRFISEGGSLRFLAKEALSDISIGEGFQLSGREIRRVVNVVHAPKTSPYRKFVVIEG